MESFTGLLAEHAEIADRAADVRRAAQRAADGTGDARQAVVSLSRLLRIHLVAEDRVVHRRLLACRDYGVAETVRAARRSFAMLARDWRRYATRWTSEAIVDDPAAFAADTAALLDRLDARVVFEDEVLYPLAVGRADLPLRDGITADAIAMV